MGFWGTNLNFRKEYKMKKTNRNKTEEIAIIEYLKIMIDGRLFGTQYSLDNQNEFLEPTEKYNNSLTKEQNLKRIGKIIREEFVACPFYKSFYELGDIWFADAILDKLFEYYDNKYGIYKWECNLK